MKGNKKGLLRVLFERIEIGLYRMLPSVLFQRALSLLSTSTQQQTKFYLWAAFESIPLGCNLMKKSTRPIRHHNQLSPILSAIDQARLLKPSLVAFLQVIAQHYNVKTGSCYPSQARIAALCQLSVRQVIRIKDKIVKMGLVSVHRPNKRGCLVYSLNIQALQQLSVTARKKLSSATSSKKCHVPKSQKCHINSLSSDKHKDLNNTVTAKSARQRFLESLISGIQHELTHLTGIKQKAAYTSAIKKARIARGEIFSDEEKARRKAISERNRAAREKAAATGQLIRNLETQLITWSRTGTGFTSEHASMLEQYSSILGAMAKPLLKRFWSTHRA